MKPTPLRGLICLKLLLDENYKRRFLLAEQLIAVQESAFSSRYDFANANADLLFVNQFINILENKLYEHS